MRNGCNTSIGKPQRKALARHRDGWKDNIKTNSWIESIKIGLKETGCENVDWIQLAHERRVGLYQNVPEITDNI
jgi:hypothetical protein